MKKYFFLGLLAAVFAPHIIEAQLIDLNLTYPKFGPFDLAVNQTFPEIIGFFYYFIVTISGLAAFAMLVWGGVQWLLSGAVPSQASAARDRLKNAILGLLLILASVLIIQTINPALTIIGGSALESPCVDPANDCSPVVADAAPANTPLRVKAPPGVYLCKEELCKGEFIDDGDASNDDWLYIDTALPGCDVIDDLSDIPLSCAPQVTGPSPLDWDNKTEAVRFDHTEWSVTLFQDPVPSPGNQAICYRTTALIMDRYHRGYFGAGAGTPTSWRGAASAMRVDLKDGPDSCASHGITLPSEADAPPSIDQPAVFFFKQSLFNTAGGRWIVGYPLNAWGPLEDSGDEAWKSQYGHDGPGVENIDSIWIEGAKRCKPIGPSLPFEKCSVFISSVVSPFIPPINAFDGGDPFICFNSSVVDTEVRDSATGDYQYSFDCGATSMARTTNSVQLGPASQCAEPGVLQNVVCP